MMYTVADVVGVHPVTLRNAFLNSRLLDEFRLGTSSAAE